MALARGAWAEARARFADSLAQAETPEAYEGMGLAARYELDAEAAIEAHERGYRLARSLGDAATAARLAIQLGHDAYAFRGPAEASGGSSSFSGCGSAERSKARSAAGCNGSPRSSSASILAATQRRSRTCTSWPCSGRDPTVIVCWGQ